jgi:hypothetical protein
MNSDQIEKLIKEAIANLFAHQSEFWDFTSATNQTEWNIAHHLANQLHAMQRHYHCDLDVSKPNMDARRPDIILHRRRRHNQNFLVIEVKRHVGDVDYDIVKIRDWWFSPPLLYHLGAVVAVPDGAELGDCFVSVFTNPHHPATANTVGR